MRVLHTADWHLGRIFAGFDLLETQRHALDGIVDIAATTRPDAIVVAGDLYDRAVPPEDAVLLLDETFMRLSRLAPVLAIAGNHDSGRRLDFGRRLMREAGVHLAGTSRSGVESVAITDRHGPVHFHLLPYATPEEVRFESLRDDVRNHDDATRARISKLDIAFGRHLLVAHLFAQGGQETKESERDISVGGVSTVANDAFRPFCYTALGHLHRPHHMADGRIRYAGSLCPYSFAEAGHRKTVSIVEIDAVGGVSIEEIEIPQRFGMRTLRGSFDGLLQAATTDAARDRDLVQVVLTDAVVVPGAREKLRDLYPHLLGFTVEPDAGARVSAPETATAVRTRSPHEFVTRFLDDRYPGVADDAVRALARGCMERAVAGEEPT